MNTVTMLNPRNSVDELTELGLEIERDGIAAHESQVRDVVARARHAGVNPILVDLLAGRSEPAVARQRAYGRVGLELVRPAAVHATAQPQRVRPAQPALPVLAALTAQPALPRAATREPALAC